MLRNEECGVTEHGTPLTVQSLQDSYISTIRLTEPELVKENPRA